MHLPLYTGLSFTLHTRTVTLQGRISKVKTQESWFQRVTCLSFRNKSCFLWWCNPTLLMQGLAATWRMFILHTELNSELRAVYSAQAMKNSALHQTEIKIRTNTNYVKAPIRDQGCLQTPQCILPQHNAQTCSECTVYSRIINHVTPQSLPAAPCKNHISCSNGCFSKRLGFTAQYLNNNPYNTAIHAFGLMIIK